MSRTNERRVLDALATEGHRRIEPPEHLADRIKEEVPASLELAPELEPDAARIGSRRLWLAAAAVLVALGAGLVGVRVVDRAPRPVDPVRPVGAPIDVQEPREAARAEAGRGKAPPSALEQAGGEAEGQPLEGPAAEQATESPRPKVSGPAPRATGAGEASLKVRQDAVERATELELSTRKQEDLARRLRELAGGAAPTAERKTPDEPRSYEVRQSQERVQKNARVEALARRLSADSASSLPEVPPAGAVPPSTGGTAEPNDGPYGDVFFRGYGTNPFLDTEDDARSTFGLDVDTGSWGLVRRYLRDGHLPPREAVRVEELVNAFDYGDAPPETEDFRIVAEGGRTPFAGRAAEPRYRLVRFGLAARDVDPSERKPAVLTFVVDVSGSMAREDRLGLVKRALDLLLDQLREGDRVALVVYGSRGRVVLEPTGDLESIRAAVGRLAPEGATNAEEGLALAYDLARRAYREGAINRVILCSDGVANVGRTGPESVLERIGAEARRGIELTTVGFGMGNYNDVLMEQLADRGDGMYAYVDDLDGARRVFVENLTGTLQTVARDAKVQVELDPEVVARYRLLGYENRDVPDERFRDDTVDAGEVGAGHTVTALYEVKLRKGIDPESRRDRRRTAMTLRLRWESVETGEAEEMERRVTVGNLASSWEEAPRALRLASVVAEFAEALKRTYWARDVDLEELFRRAQGVSADYPGDLEVAELATLVGRAARIREAEEAGRK